MIIVVRRFDEYAAPTGMIGVGDSMHKMAGPMGHMIVAEAPCAN